MLCFMTDLSKKYPLRAAACRGYFYHIQLLSRNLEKIICTGWASSGSSFRWKALRFLLSKWNNFTRISQRPHTNFTAAL